MKRYFYLVIISFLTSSLIIFSACNNNSNSSSEKKEPKLKEENITYNANGVTMDGYVVYDENVEGKRPAVIVVPEWWGLVEYPKKRARELAELGYVAMAIDMYGNGKTADTPDSASKLSAPFYQDLSMTKSRFDAALNRFKEYSEVDTNNIAAIGYCFGGGVVANVAKMGEELKGIVSFHGTLAGAPPEKNMVKAKILVCQGADDKFVSQADVDTFKKQMDSVGADCIVQIYPGATHAFTNPKATELGEKFNIPIAYNAAADTASWNEMKDFFGRIFK